MDDFGEEDEKQEAMERDEYRRKVRFFVVLSGLVLLWVFGKLVSAHLHLIDG